MDWFDNWPKSSPRCRSRLFGFGLFWKVWQNFWPWRLTSIFCFLQTLPFLCVGCGKRDWNASGPLYRSWSDRLVEYILPCSGIEITPEYKVAKFLGETDEAMGTLCLLQTTRFFPFSICNFLKTIFVLISTKRKKKSKELKSRFCLTSQRQGTTFKENYFNKLWRILFQLGCGWKTKSNPCSICHGEQHLKGCINIMPLTSTFTACLTRTQP